MLQRFANLLGGLACLEVTVERYLLVLGFQLIGVLLPECLLLEFSLLAVQFGLTLELGYLRFLAAELQLCLLLLLQNGYLHGIGLFGHLCTELRDLFLLGGKSLGERQLPGLFHSSKTGLQAFDLGILL